MHTEVDRSRGHGDPATSPAVHFATHLNSSDTLLWNIEQDPCLRTTIIAISLLDRSPDWQRLVQRVSDTVERVPRLRQRVVVPPMRMGQPRWEPDDHFDISYHLRRVVVPAPGDFRAVLDIAEPIAMAAFDKARPLWEFTLVEGMAGGRAAFIQKVHHAFTDGVGAVHMATLLHDPKRASPRRAAVRSAEPDASPNAFVEAANSLASDLRSAVMVPLRFGSVAPRLTMMAATDPVGLTRSTARGLRSVGRLLAPVTAPLSPTMTGRGLSRRLDSFDVALPDLLAAGHAAGCSLNDAFLASIAGGMRMYHERHGAAVQALRVTMPINLRRDGDGLGNNRFTPVRFTLPIATLDPVDRMRELGHLARNWRKEPALPLTDLIAGVLDRLPVVATTTLFGSMLKGVDFVATNVPGPTTRSYLAGAEVVSEYGFAPPSGAAFSVALFSHLDRCCIGINADAEAVPDVDVLADCLADGFDEVLLVGKTSRRK